MKRILLASPLFLVASEALACPQCTYDRAAPTWFLFATLRILVVCAISFKVLDVVRTVEAFIVYELGYFFAWRVAVWYSHPAVSEGLIVWLGLGFLLVLSAGFPAVIVLKWISKIEWFRRTPDKDISWRRALMIVPAFFMIAITEAFLTGP
jgi:uncharacterized membrane protein YesL